VDLTSGGGNVELNKSVICDESNVIGWRNAATGMRQAGLMVMQTTVLAPIEKLVELYYLPLFNLALRLYGNPAKAMVLTQRTFRLAFDFSRTLPVPTNVRAWLFAILFNKFMEGIPRVQRARTGVPVSDPVVERV
jgi:DNA-directed RNA polymerase specialized sigma24 family protein